MVFNEWAKIYDLIINMPHYYFLVYYKTWEILLNGLHIDGGHGNVNGENLKWLNTSDSIYLQMLYERVRNGPNNGSTFMMFDYQWMDKEIFIAIGTRYDPNKLRAKYNHLHIWALDVFPKTIGSNKSHL